MEVPGSKALEEAVWSHIEHIPFVPRASVQQVLVSGPGRQNRHSSRIGAEIQIHMRGHARPPVRLWAKWVESPEAALACIQSAYDRARSAGVQAPIPRAFFAVPSLGLIFLDKLEGTPLRGLVYRFAAGSRKENERIVLAFREIGRWLWAFQQANKLEAQFNLDELLDAIDLRARQDPATRSALSQRVTEFIDRSRRLSSHTALNAVAVHPHNDFTLRNILLGDGENFFVLDWDAMVHPDFSQVTGIWWDVALFVINLNSLSRFRPIIRESRLVCLRRAFLGGYLEAAQHDGYDATWEVAARMLKTFVLRYWYGIGTDRTLREVYQRHMGWRYCNQLERQLSQGDASGLGVQ